ncbi:Asparagine synthetase [glutamine-hydrolyzing] 2 [Senna tora]|uniref:Asparagine synthetase [glutamine-hydrolyzing] 2 n=1 Tax=Senna tora TaxID=362788 RepID=A0A835CF77_9FABA|nr:Asparagine synthetase [glutamine-hydrolyzing] 2 [Senna tora]
MYGVEKSPPRQLDDARTLGLRVIDATEDCKYSTHGGFACVYSEGEGEKQKMAK